MTIDIRDFKLHSSGNFYSFGVDFTGEDMKISTSGWVYTPDGKVIGPYSDVRSTGKQHRQVWTDFNTWLIIKTEAEYRASLQPIQLRVVATA